MTSAASQAPVPGRRVDHDRPGWCRRRAAARPAPRGRARRTPARGGRWSGADIARSTRRGRWSGPGSAGSAGRCVRGIGSSRHDVGAAGTFVMRNLPAVRMQSAADRLTRAKTCWIPVTDATIPHRGNRVLRGADVMSASEVRRRVAVHPRPARPGDLPDRHSAADPHGCAGPRRRLRRRHVRPDGAAGRDVDDDLRRVPRRPVRHPRRRDVPVRHRQGQRHRRLAGPRRGPVGRRPGRAASRGSCSPSPASLTAFGAVVPAAVAIIAPIGMGFALRYRINPVLMGLMIINGATAGGFSPISIFGIITNGVVERNDLAGQPAVAVPAHRWSSTSCSASSCSSCSAAAS